MKFNSKNVFTCLNADSLKIGSKVVFADNLDTLQKVVDDYDNCILYSQHNEDKHPNELSYAIDTLAKIGNKASSHRFIKHNADNLDTAWILAYLLKEPTTPRYVPFTEDNDLILKVVKSIESDIKTVILTQDDVGVSLIDYNVINGYEVVSIDYSTLLDKYTFIDNAPCGIMKD